MARFLPKEILVYLAWWERAILGFARNFHASLNLGILLQFGEVETQADDSLLFRSPLVIVIALAVCRPFVFQLA